MADERRWSPRRRDGPELKKKFYWPTAVHHMVRASGNDDSLSHRRSLPMYSIGNARGNSASQSAVGTTGVGCQNGNRQASVCLRQPSRPRTYETKTSNANPRKQRSDGFRWAPFGPRSNDGETIATKNARRHKSRSGRCRQASVSSANGCDHAVAASDHPLQ